MADGVNLDTLEIQIEAKSQSAASKIDELCKKIDILSDGFKKLDIGNINKVAGAIGNVSGSLKNVSNIKGDGIRDVANALNTLSKVNVANLNSLAGSIPALQKSLDGIGAVTFNSDGLNAVGEALRQFGYKTSTLGTQNLEKLKTDLVEFINGINSAGAVNFDFSGLENLVQNLSRLGSKNVTQAAANLQPLKEQLLDFINGLNSAGGFDTSGLNDLVSDISKLGGKSVTNAIVNLPQLESALTQVLQTLSTAPKVSQNVIDLTNALANLAAQGSKVGNASNSIVKGLNRTNTAAKSTKKSMTSLAAVFGKFYASCFLVIRGVKKLWESIESSMDYIETSNYFEVSLSQISKQFERYGYESAEAYGEALEAGLSNLNSKLTGYTLGTSGEALFSGDVGLGMDIESMMNFQAKTLAVTNSVGLLGNASVETTKALSMLAGDLSSLTNLDISSVMDSLSSGLIGQSRALYKYGIDITNNTLQQYALAEGIDKAVSEMTQSEKMQLRLLAILDQSQVAWGDLGNTVNSVANQYRVFEQQIGNLGRTLGNLFLPIVKNVLPYVNGLIIALNNLFTTLGFDIWGDSWLEDLQDGISGSVTDDLEGIEDAADSALESMNELLKGVRGFDVLNVISTGSSTSNRGGVTDELQGTIDLTDSITKAVANYESAWNKAFETAENKASEFAETLKEMFEKTNAVKNFSSIVNSIKEFKEAVTPFTVGFAQGFIDFIGTVANISLEVFTTSLDLLSGVLKKISPDTLEKVGKAFGVLAGTVGTFTLLTGVEKKFTQLASGFATLGTALTAHPILASFTLAAGVIAFLDKYIFGGSEIQSSNTAQKIADDINTISNSLNEAEEKFSSSNVLAENIDVMYQKWSELNSRVGELTDGEKALLKVYADKLKEYCAEVIPYIDEDGIAFESVSENIQQAIRNVQLYYKTLASEEYLGELVSSQISLEFNIEDTEEKIEELYNLIREFAPNLEKGVIDYYAKNVDKVAERYTTIFGEIVDQPTFDKNAESAENWARQLGLTLSQTEEFAEKLQQLSELSELLELKSSAINELEKVNNRIEKVTESYIEYKNAIENTTKSVEESQLPLITTEDIWVDIYKQVMDGKKAEEEAAEATKQLGDAVSETVTQMKGLSKVIDELDKKEVNIPISIGGSGSTLSELKGNLNSKLTIKAFAGGGFVNSGEIFVARENGLTELVGNFGGKTGVANNDQIISGIKQAAYEGFLAAIEQTGNIKNSGVTVVLEGDAAKIFKMVRQEEENYFNSTGRSAFQH